VITLRDYQHQAIEAVRQVYRRGSRAVLLVMPTGSGKTCCFTYIVAAAQQKQKRILLVAHRRELVAQISAALTQWEVPHGLILPERLPTSHAVQVAMVQTLARRVAVDRVGRYRFDLIVIDEAHHLSGESSWAKVVAHSPMARLLGVTATPCRLDGRPLGRSAGGFFDALVQGPTVLELIQRGYLCRPVVYAPAEAGPDVSRLKIWGGDYVAKQLEQAMDQSPLTGDAVVHYARYAHRLPAIAFCVTIAHAAHVREQFRATGYQAALLTSQTTDRERAQLLADLGRGQLHVLASVNTISEGTDVPIVAAAILLRPTASYGLHVQQSGRVLRPYPGKPQAILLDHAGNTWRHGLITETVKWSLNSLSARPAANSPEATPRVKRCPRCTIILDLASTRCPHCGQRWPARAVAQTVLTGPAVRAGELVEIDAVEVARQRRQEQSRARTLEELEHIAEQRGYKPGWAQHVWEAREARQQR
jgi:superfamily II DNA or RNA helicase